MFHKGGWTVDFVAAGLVVLLSLLVVYGAKEGSLFNIGDHGHTIQCFAQRRDTLVILDTVTTTPSNSNVRWSTCSAASTRGRARAGQGWARQSCQSQAQATAVRHSTPELEVDTLNQLLQV